MYICCVYRCKNRYVRSYNDAEDDVKFYHFPNSTCNPHMPWLTELRQKWINAVKNHVRNPKSWQPGRYTTICSAHFIGNRKSDNCLHPSCIPTIFNDKISPENIKYKLRDFERQQRRIRRKFAQNLHDTSEGSNKAPKTKSGSMGENTRSTKKNAKCKNNEIETFVSNENNSINEEVDCNSEEDILQTNLYKATAAKRQQKPDSQHCKVCFKKIKGPRYVCLQCFDFNICSTCEFCGAHPFHYMLRVPRDQPEEDVELVVDVVRDSLLNFLPINEAGNDFVDCVQSETEGNKNQLWVLESESEETRENCEKEDVELVVDVVRDSLLNSLPINEAGNDSVDCVKSEMEAKTNQLWVLESESEETRENCQKEDVGLVVDVVQDSSLNFLPINEAGNNSVDYVESETEDNKNQLWLLELESEETRQNCEKGKDNSSSQIVPDYGPTISKSNGSSIKSKKNAYCKPKREIPSSESESEDHCIDKTHVSSVKMKERKRSKIIERKIDKTCHNVVRETYSRNLLNVDIEMDSQEDVMASENKKMIYLIPIENWEPELITQISAQGSRTPIPNLRKVSKEEVLARLQIAKCLDPDDAS